MKKKIFMFQALVILFLVAVALNASLYTVREIDQVIITQFNRIVGEPKTRAGLNMRTPFIQKVNRIDRRILQWDGRPTDMPTKNKQYISVDTFGRWRIVDPRQYFVRLKNERSAQSRLDDILGSETRNAVARHDLIEVIRSTVDRVPEVDESIAAEDRAFGQLVPVTKGRTRVEEEIFAAAAPKLMEFGIELLDVRFKRVNYNPSVRGNIYKRMISERQQIAERFRSEGRGEAARIIGDKERELDRIQSEAYKSVEEIRGDADATATEIYAEAYNQSEDAAAFYEFMKTMETYERVIDPASTLILSTDSDIFRFLKRVDSAPAGN